ncbi:dihydroneopterin aldolase [Blochmannia endosymbiont of Camponotus sp.]|uniref:dihydroneopterin aldolase n=1 Tax=Blochmannia endosymbiont of Camponotus sp. TaxID=700220 RepID=UPI0020241A34|nr:dihydroneopterin aldolase [Blochmannia endosymbiont of Camponotus sp.]URJ29735.1 dihydroneopterin aldolase [Blochmannia endosymbiont of Camponotus sp.]URJ31365.1 dihydroneopterin aldolase [Blochmannia endosymbiont of Camponotus sp.]
MNILFIEQLTVMAYIGIYDWEKKSLQRLIFDLQLSYDTAVFLGGASKTSYVDYTHVSQTILDLVSKKYFYLIEDVANLTVNTLVKKFCVYWIRVKVSKPGAIRGASNVGVCIERKVDIY